MTSDVIIILTSLCGFFVFLSFFSFTTYKFPQYPIQNIFFSICTSLFMSIILSWVYIPELFIRALVIFLTNFLAFVYVFVVYLNLDSSLHVRILKEMAIAGQKGLTYKELLSKYNKKIILEKRLLRLVNSREIERVGESYKFRRRFSTLLIREKFIIILTKLYGR